MGTLAYILALTVTVVFVNVIFYLTNYGFYNITESTHSTAPSKLSDFNSNKKDFLQINTRITPSPELRVTNQKTIEIDNWFVSVVKNSSSKLKNESYNLRKERVTPQSVKKPEIRKKVDQIRPISKEVKAINISVLHAVTYASHGGRDDRFCRAVESALHHKFDLIILGWGVKWQGLSQKLEAAHAYAASIPKDHVLLFTDAFDVMFANTPDHVLTEFYAMNARIVFGAECGCWPHVMDDPPACFTKYPKSSTPYRYLNSGTWIGYAADATEMLAEVIQLAGQNFKNANDQKLVADMYMAGRYGIQLDFQAKLFQSMHMTLDPPLPHCDPHADVTETGSGHWINKRTGSVPAVFHFNGGGKRYHLDMEGRMWYKRVASSAISSRWISVPTSPNKRLVLNDICPGYLKWY